MSSPLNRTSRARRVARRPLAVRVTPFVGLCVLGLGVLGLCGCNTLPSNGPDVVQVVRAAKGSAPAFAIVDLDAASVEAANHVAPPTGSIAPLSGVLPTGLVNAIHVGDTLRVTLYEIGASLFATAGSASPGGAATEPNPGAVSHTFPDLQVQPDGAIALPYVGDVQAAGKAPDQVAGAIEAALHGQSESPQVIVSVREDQGNTVMLMGDIHSPGRKLLSYRRETLLEMIALAGGPTQDSVDMRVRVTRHGQAAEMPLSDIVSGGPDDIALQPQDRIELLYRPPSFTAFGAAGKVSQVPFHADRLNLAEAMGRIGGPLDQLADPTGVFIFRARQDASHPRVVWRLNLKDPRSYFIAQSFVVQDKDVIFVANARSNSLAKFLAIINNVISPVVTAKYLGS
jgi:polysaccharide export outer membrane protein